MKDSFTPRRAGRAVELQAGNGEGRLQQDVAHVGLQARGQVGQVIPRIRVLELESDDEQPHPDRKPPRGTAVGRRGDAKEAR